ncbi:hypothetical protein CLAFUW4_00893 [Fulvia fulva]|uniref:Uncharacterized protein n=1 Tax=Passalora fulva TaxID=5499 RepID=A0A9Q8L6C8_PASFU|nr:uncharacterized protein CLAFUR5_00896 [Fulvia fulva]KAK4635703.1 hypothetical protein CLAFUR4_00894 [Fulvia fulva]KAK4637844.1 hypothetical protein CLAFUR0_00894 [Fulvia fulva]UJO11643.1 hypothetical protein CLAFUR5_00896 [Fulvia fulva]WPV08754.1 hypothetical protein CLAFUW4_00893 [Fulvia fulva]WPV23561.1 hypothetical protein CLAFUW7_00923 [Fulvia fulva]
MSTLSKQQEQGGDEPELSESELDSYIISVPDLNKSKKSSKPSKLPATPKKGNKKVQPVVDASTPSTVNYSSPAKSYTSTSTPEKEGTPSKKKNIGWFGTDARVFSSPLKGSSRKA